MNSKANGFWNSLRCVIEIGDFINQESRTNARLSIVGYFFVRSFVFLTAYQAKPDRREQDRGKENEER